MSQVFTEKYAQTLICDEIASSGTNFEGDYKIMLIFFDKNFPLVENLKSRPSEKHH